MDVSLELKDRFAPENNTAAVQSYYLRGTWKSKTAELKMGYDKLVISNLEAEGKVESAVEFSVFDFPLADPPHLTRQVTSVLEGTTDYTKGQIEYCVYQIKGAKYNKLNLACSQDGITMPPEATELEKEANQFAK